MASFVQNLFFFGVFIFVSMSRCCYWQVPDPDFPSYRFAMVRELSSSFEDSLKLNPPAVPIDLNLAKQQHENYIQLLQGQLKQVIQLKADSNHPDCNFIEDTAIIVGDIAVISRMGAVDRQGEEIEVAQAIANHGTKSILFIQSPGTMDGGDILYTGKHLFVGQSCRTNAFAFQQLKEIFQGIVEVVEIPVVEGLHLKSVVSFFDSDTLVVASSKAGTAVQSMISQVTNNAYTFIEVPDSVASNVLRIGPTLIVQDGFPDSQIILQELCNSKQVNLVTINMSELIKADGALTCGCLLFN